MVIYIVIAFLIIAFLMRQVEGFFSGYFYVAGGNKDDCNEKDGIITCKEKGLFPAWFYPSYYGQGKYPDSINQKRPGYRYKRRGDRLYRYNH